MEFSDFLQVFYLPEEGGGIVGCKGKKKTTLFFFENGLDDEYDSNIICPSESTAEKWLTGARHPESTIWAEVLKHFDEIKLQKALLAQLSDKALRTVLNGFDVPLEKGESPDKMMLAKAITVQFRAIASGGGRAENIVSKEYRKPPELQGFGTYLREAKRKLRSMKLPGEGECLLSEFYVCNNIGTSSASFPHRIRGNYIEKATLPKIRNFDRRWELKNVILIGACGYGKTLMMQHLFLDAADNIADTGLLPVFAELRNYSSGSGDLVSFLVESSQEFDRGLTKEKLEDVLERGQAEILLDGLDEMDPEETRFFQRKIAELCHHYPNNQVVISSRQCSAIKGIRGFTSLYIHPLTDDQISLLIDKLLIGEDDEKAKDTVFTFLDAHKGYVKKNGFLATNPMLLTILVRNYEKFRDIKGNRTNFYELMYEMLIKGHDEDKESFVRFFHSVGSSDEFTLVFREFCARAYMEGVFEFDRRSFERFFKQIRSKNVLHNASKFEVSAFQHDVCATACMMYEQESGIFYIDPGFQDYFFAEYYYFEDVEPTKEMGRSLWDRKTDSFRNLDALKMFYDIAPEKATICIIKPYLDCIFKSKNDTEAFLRFLSYGYGQVKYTLLNKILIEKYLKKPIKAEKFDIALDSNITNNVVQGLISELLDLPNTFVVGAFEDTVKQDKATHFIAGFYDKTKVNESEDEQTLLRGIKHEVVYINDKEYFQDMEFTPIPIMDSSGSAVCFGFTYNVDPLSFTEDQCKAEYLIELCQKANLDSVFKKMKQYYLQILDNQKVNEYK